MTDPSPLTARELAVAKGCGHRWTVKKIATELGISERRVRVLITAVAVKIHVPDGCDDRLCVGDWWLALAPVSLTAKKIA